MRSADDLVILYRHALRQILHHAGVRSNPGVNDNWILDEVSKKILDKPVDWSKCTLCELTFLSPTSAFLHAIESHREEMKV